MHYATAILLSQNQNIISKCIEAGEVVNLKIFIKSDFASFLLELQENDYNVAVCDCTMKNSDCLNWVKVIKRMIPKIPIIIITDEMDKNDGARLYEEKIFNLIELPVSTEMLEKIFFAAVSNKDLKDRID